MDGITQFRHPERERSEQSGGRKVPGAPVFACFWREITGGAVRDGSFRIAGSYHIDPDSSIDKYAIYLGSGRA
jgi:hypothetical protein